MSNPAYNAYKFGPPMGERKTSNPKDLLGMRKVPLSTMPIRVLWRVGLAMLEGAAKYGRHNYRQVGVRASVYFDACCRHVFSWWEGEDLDPDSNLNHIDKAIACLMVLRDSMLEGNWADDRPPRTANDLALLNTQAAALLDRHAGCGVIHHTEIARAKVMRDAALPTMPWPAIVPGAEEC